MREYSVIFKVELAIVVVVYAMAVIMYYTSQRNYMPGKEFGTAKLEAPAKVNKILICGGSGAGKTFYEVKPNLMQMPHRKIN